MPAEPLPQSIENLREVAPKLIELTSEVVFGDVWERPELSKRDRSLITIAALTALYRTEQLKGHIGRGLDNGLSEEEIGELITHIAFYAGWPNAVNAAGVARDVFAARANPAAAQPEPDRG